MYRSTNQARGNIPFIPFDRLRTGFDRLSTNGRGNQGLGRSGPFALM
jgi:hypothetical protein